ncbi:hypothetical protein BHM03_00023621 [Ensete ventricosum]|nr:hypothetical protein BHM03_00023621 [Ensete ventricosum]
MLLSDTEENFPERLSDPIPVSGVNCQYQMRKMEQFDRSIYLDDAKHMIPDSFEDDCTVHIKKHSTMAYGIDCIASDITREKMITAKPVIAETEKVQDPSATDKVVMMAKETEKGECFLTDSLEHCLEEALNDDLFAQKENVSDASCSLGACVDHELQYLNPAFNKHDDFQNLNTGNGDVLEEMVIPEKTAFDTSGLQFTPDSQSLVFLSSIKVPLCRFVRNINCSCQTCKSDCHEENAVRVGQVNFGYVLPLAKLMTTERVSCILVCEPNYLIAAEASGTLHVWLMNCKWRDVSRRALLATFSSPGNLIFQMLPVGIFGNKDETIFSAAQEMEHMQEILKANDWVTEDAANPLPLRQDIAVWILVSAASDLEDQVAYQLKEPNRRPDRWWRLALLLKNMVIMGSVLDPR